GDLDLAEETGCPDVCGDIGAKHLHSNRALVLQVMSKEDFRHPYLPQFPLVFIASPNRPAQPFKESRHYPATPLDVSSTSIAVAITLLARVSRRFSIGSSVNIWVKGGVARRRTLPR